MHALLDWRDVSSSSIEGGASGDGPVKKSRVHPGGQEMPFRSDSVITDDEFGLTSRIRVKCAI